MNVTAPLRPRGWNHQRIGQLCLLAGSVVLVTGLLVGQYRGMVAQQQAAEMGFLAHTRTQAATLENFLGRINNELADLSERRVVTAYFENKALGITMQYGLKISLLDLADEIHGRLERTLPSGAPLFARMALVDNEGNIVLDSRHPDAAPGAPWPLALADASTPAPAGHPEYVNQAPEGPCLMIQAPCQVKTHRVGTLVALIPLRTVLGLLQDPSAPTSDDTWVLLRGRLLIAEPLQARSAAMFAHVQALTTEPGKVIRTKARIGSQGNQHFMTACARVADLPLSVIRITPFDQAVSGADPRRVLGTLFLALGAVVAGLLLYVRSKSREATLTEKLTFEAERRAMAARQNEALAEEILQRKVVEQQLRKAKEDAEAANQAKGQFLANMSHEIRTPLNGVLGLTELVLGTELGPAQKEYLTIALQSGRSLLHIINDILDISRIEAGRMVIEAVPFDLRSELESILGPFHAAVQQKTLELELAVAPDLPDRWRGDPLRLRQVLINLLANAVKFTPAGRVRLEVAWEPRAPGQGALRFLVSDTGIGIPAEKLETIFEAFSQADGSTTRLYGGTGLGLTISHQLARLMGGELLVESEPGRGSVFTLHLTLGIEEDLQRPGPEEPAEDPFRPLQALRILIAEDNAVNRFYLTNLLLKMGHSTRAVEDGRQALQALSEESFDLALLDVQMPHLSGPEAARAWRQHEEQEKLPPLPLIALTAHAMPEDRRTCLEAGMDDYLTKPLDVQLLAKALTHWSNAAGTPS